MTRIGPYKGGERQVDPEVAEGVALQIEADVKLREWKGRVRGQRIMEQVLKRREVEGVDLDFFSRGNLKGAKEGGEIYATNRVVMGEGQMSDSYYIMNADLTSVTYVTRIKKGMEHCDCGHWRNRGSRLRIPCKHMWGVLAYEMGGEA